MQTDSQVLLASAATLPPQSKTIYRYGKEYDDPTKFWFSWDTEVNVAPSPLADNKSGWVYFSYAGGSQPPRATFAAIATSTSARMPVGTVPLGVKPSDRTPIATVTGSYEPSPGDLPDARVYTFVWVVYIDTFTLLSAPSPVSNEVSPYEGQAVTVSSLPTQIPDDIAEYVTAGATVEKWIYRTVNGQYIQAGKVGLGASEFVDSTTADNLGPIMLSADWEPPPDDLTGLVSLSNGMLAGFRKGSNTVCLSEPYRPYAWPPQYQFTVDYEVVALGAIDATVAILTTGKPAFLQGAAPQSMAMVTPNIEQACASARSVVSLRGQVLYASPDGIVSLSSNGSQVITGAVYRRDQWQDLLPEEMVGYTHDSKYFLISPKIGLIFDLLTTNFYTFKPPVGWNAAYSDPITDDLYYLTGYGKNSQIMAWERGGSTRPYQWVSKVFSLPQPMVFSCIQVEATDYSDLTLTVLADGEELLTCPISSRYPIRLPPVRARDWQWKITGENEVFAIAMAQSMAEIARG